MSDGSKTGLLDTIGDLSFQAKYEAAMDGVVRRATPEDKEGVVNINTDVYVGLDYLGSYYDHFMVSEHIIGYVYEIRGKIVAFVAECFIDGGHTVVDRAGRVNPRYQGQGIYTKMLSEIREDILPYGPQRKVIVTSIPKSKSFYENKDKVLEKAMHYFRCDSTGRLFRDAVDGNSTYRDIQDCHYLNQEDLTCLILNKDTSHYLFPKERIVVDWVPYRLTSSNIPLVFGKDSIFVSDVTTQDGQVTGLLSAGTFVRTQGETNNYIMDFHGCQFKSLNLHLLAHSKRICENNYDVKTVTVAAEKELKREGIEESLAKFGCVSAPDLNSIFSMLELFESPL